MPHFIVEYSANLEAAIEVPDLLLCIHKAAEETGMFPAAGIRVRAARRDHYSIADRHPENAFVHVSARVGAGRTPDVRQNAAKHIFAALCDFLALEQEKRALGISFEMVEIDDLTNLKKNNTHELVKARRQT